MRRTKAPRFPEPKATILELLEVGIKWRHILSAVDLEWRQVTEMMAEDPAFRRAVDRMKEGAPRRRREARILAWLRDTRRVSLDPEDTARLAAYEAAMARVPPEAR